MVINDKLLRNIFKQNNNCACEESIFRILEGGVRGNFIFSLDNFFIIKNCNKSLQEYIGELSTLEPYTLAMLIDDDKRYQRIIEVVSKKNVWSEEVSLKIGSTERIWVQLTILSIDGHFFGIGVNKNVEKRDVLIRHAISLLSSKSIELANDLDKFIDYNLLNVKTITQCSASLFFIFNTDQDSSTYNHIDYRKVSPGQELAEFTTDIFDHALQGINKLIDKQLFSFVDSGNEYWVYGRFNNVNEEESFFIGSIYRDQLSRTIRRGELDFFLTFNEHKIDQYLNLKKRIIEVHRTNAIIEKIGIGLWEFNVLENTMKWDNNMYKLYGIESEDFSGAYEAWQSSLHPNDIERVSSDIENALIHARDVDSEFRIVCKDGDFRWIRTKAFINKDDNGIPFMMTGISTDITSEVQAREEIEYQKNISMNNARLASIGELAASIGHEINNPLTIISSSMAVMNMKMQKEELTSELFTKHYDRIYTTVNQVSSIVNGLRNLTRNSKGEESESCHLYDLMADCTSMYIEKCKSNGVRLEFSLLDYKGLMVVCDRVQVSQVLVNILNNAYFAVIKGGKDMWVKIILNKFEDRIEMHISDSGSGIEENIKDKIFDPFFTTKKIGEGTGLGLSLSKKIMLKHGGDLNLKLNTLNTFIVKLPMIYVGGV
jgi:PAS domain S-box-containing protein